MQATSYCKSCWSFVLSHYWNMLTPTKAELFLKHLSIKGMYVFYLKTQLCTSKGSMLILLNYLLWTCFLLMYFDFIVLPCKIQLLQKMEKQKKLSVNKIIKMNFTRTFLRNCSAILQIHVIISGWNKNKTRA